MKLKTSFFNMLLRMGAKAEVKEGCRSKVVKRARSSSERFSSELKKAQEKAKLGELWVSSPNLSLFNASVIVPQRVERVDNLCKATDLPKENLSPKISGGQSFEKLDVEGKKLPLRERASLGEGKGDINGAKIEKGPPLEVRSISKGEAFPLDGPGGNNSRLKFNHSEASKKFVQGEVVTEMREVGDFSESQEKPKVGEWKSELSLSDQPKPSPSIAKVKEEGAKSIALDDGGKLNLFRKLERVKGTLLSYGSEIQERILETPREAGRGEGKLPPSLKDLSHGSEIWEDRSKQRLDQDPKLSFDLRKDVPNLVGREYRIQEDIQVKPEFEGDLSLKVEKLFELPQGDGNGSSLVGDGGGEDFDQSLTFEFKGALEEGSLSEFPKLSDTFGDFLKKFELNLKDGKREAVVELYPPELGKVKFEIEVQGDKITARFWLPSQEVKSLFENNLQQLQSLFRSQGYLFEADFFLGGELNHRGGGYSEPGSSEAAKEINSLVNAPESETSQFLGVRGVMEDGLDILA